MKLLKKNQQLQSSSRTPRFQVHKSKCHGGGALPDVQRSLEGPPGNPCHRVWSEGQSIASSLANHRGSKARAHS